MGEWRYSSTIPDIGTRWRWVGSFTPRPLYLRGNRPRDPLDRRLGETQSLFGRCGPEKDLTPVGNRTAVVQSTARCYIYSWRFLFIVLSVTVMMSILTDAQGYYAPQLHLHRFDQSHIVTISFCSRPGIYNVNASVTISFHHVCLAVAR
jgi:hypothetical protein